MNYFPEEAKMMTTEAVERGDMQRPMYDEPQRTVSARLGLLEQQLEKLAEAVEYLRSDTERLKGALG